jgi:hypothetical protein
MNLLLAAHVALLTSAGLAFAEPQDAGWKAGTARIVITPEEHLWMAGFAARTKPAEGKAQDLFAKALALEDASGARLVIVTTDLISIPRPLRTFVEQQATEKFQLPRASLLLNASHTHCGPVLRAGPSALYDLSPEQSRMIEQYLNQLQNALVALVGQALDDLAPARVSYSHARAGFAMNRRLPSEKGYQNSPNPEGPVDHDVPTLRIDGPDGKLRGVLFGYACHNTTLSFNMFCGDYAGFAQQDLEAAHPGVTALFLMGCGGDQNPYPRNTLELAQQHGRTLANAVEAALLPRSRPLRGTLRSALESVDLEFARVPTREELQQQTGSSDKRAAHRAELMLEELQKNGKIPATYSYPVQVVQFGNDLTLVALAGEVVVDYSLRLKRELAGPAVWVAGYSNDVFAYIPSARVLKEGGYEAGDAMRYTTLPGPWAPIVEEQIINQVQGLVRKLSPQPAP